jgi:hypothetical protein
MRPEPFSARFTARSKVIEEMILNEAANAREELRAYDGETKIRL